MQLKYDPLDALVRAASTEEILSLNETGDSQALNKNTPSGAFLFRAWEDDSFAFA
jgi:hypothetical protein